MALTFTHAPGATPLRPEEVARLRPELRSIKTMEQLNELEAANIAECEKWAQTSRLFKLPGILATRHIARVHKEMFDDVWLWAGRIRTHDLQNAFASPWHRVRTDLEVLWGDATHWFEREMFAPDDFAVRLHHRLVKVHAFANGNGRHARLVADLVLHRHFAAKRLTWGGAVLGEEGNERQTYISALKYADQGDYRPLLEFCRAG
jgi:Fic-DOC domain mobile mystery protein B